VELEEGQVEVICVERDTVKVLGEMK